MPTLMLLIVLLVGCASPHYVCYPAENDKGQQVILCSPWRGEVR